MFEAPPLAAPPTIKFERFFSLKVVAKFKVHSWTVPTVFIRSQLRGFISAYHPAAPGSNPMQHMDAFFILYYLICNKKSIKMKKKRPEMPYLKTNMKLWML